MTKTAIRCASAIFAAALAGTLVACTPDSVTPSGPASPSASSSVPDASQISPPIGPVSMEQAGTIATETYGGTIKSVENDSYKGDAVWEVELRDSSQGTIEVKISEEAGEILEVQQE